MQKERQGVGRGASGETLKTALMDAGLGLGEQPASDTQTRMAHEDAADTGDRPGVAACVPAHRTNELAVEPSSDGLLPHDERDISRRIDKARESRGLLLGEHIQGLRAQGRYVQVAQAGEIIEADRPQCQALVEGRGADAGSLRHTRILVFVHHICRACVPLRPSPTGHTPASRVIARSVSFMRPDWATLLRAEPRGAWLGRRLGFLVAARRWLVLRRLARAARYVLLPVAPRRLQAGIGLLTGGRNHLLDGPAGILMVIELGRRGALRLAEVSIALEVVGQRREAHREVVPIA